MLKMEQMKARPFDLGKRTEWQEVEEEVEVQRNGPAGWRQGHGGCVDSMVRLEP